MRNPWSTVLFICLLVSGCGLQRSQTAVVEYLDEDSGYTVRHLRDPIVLYREQPALAAHARDYLSLGPAVLSRGGQTDYLLWVCDWSTIDRDSWLQIARSKLALQLDSEIMELPPAKPPHLGWSPYQRPVNGGEIHYYRLTRSQMLQLLSSAELRALVGDAQGREAFLVWHAPDRRLDLLNENSAGSNSMLVRKP